jgi:hypothetical protein
LLLLLPPPLADEFGGEGEEGTKTTPGSLRKKLKII